MAGWFDRTLDWFERILDFSWGATGQDPPDRPSASYVAGFVLVAAFAAAVAVLLLVGR